MFNEDSRVKIPALLHLTRLGYQYLSLKNNNSYNPNTNIFTQIFDHAIQHINPDIELEAVKRLYEEITLDLENEDLGKAFFEKLTNRSGVKLIDFENFENNLFHVCTELTYKNGEDEFRPDIILLINGMPLVFIEVKKPNNREGILAERKRINRRFQNKKFHKFVNITQFMVFSNNMEYDPDGIDPLQGAFYASTSYHKPIFNYFREEEELNLAELLSPEEEEVENFILKDTNLNVIKHSPEFLTNKDPDTPTNRLSTALFSKNRLKFILQYAITYVTEKGGLQKHIMRYPQIFATKAIERKLNEGVKKGIIWHTQGSGKTALAFYNVQYLTDYFSKKEIIPKFYFIVDRIDLLIQAKREFTARGLIVKTVDSKEDFAKEFKKTTALHNLSGKPEITVVNIQKFKDDTNVVKKVDYSINIQRIFFLDEVHRSYNPKGSFLANLQQADPNAIKIGLTGTPLITNNVYSKDLFGDYIHKYYYNASIADGYTLKLIREEIETNYKIVLAKALEEVEVLKGNINKKEIYAHPTFVEPMLDYIIDDFEKSRLMHSEATIGGMVVCDSSDQAKMMFEIFNQKYADNPYAKMASKTIEIRKAAEDVGMSYKLKQEQKRKVKSTALILHDIGDKDTRKKVVEDFKDGKVDLLFVFNMLLTGFDAPRLKKLYIGRIIKKHNLLQTLTRVNRTYKDFRYGYVVDFADIRQEFDATNAAYFKELQAEYGEDEMERYSNMFKSKEEIETEIEDIKEILWSFDTNNKEIFSQQISQIDDRKQMQSIVKALNNIKSLYNLIRLYGHYELLDKIDFKEIKGLYIEADNHLALLRTKEALETNIDTTNLLNVALEDVIFLFTKISEEELILSDELKTTLRKTREAMASNMDKKDPKYVTLYEELERLFKNKKLSEIKQENMKANIGALNKIYEKIKALNRENNRLKAKYEYDPKFTRVHKRIKQKGNVSEKESKIHAALMDIKNKADESVLENNKLLENESYFDSLMIGIVIEQFRKNNNIPLNLEASKYINHLIVQEYINEFEGRTI